jgi:hypothetical protein
MRVTVLVPSEDYRTYAGSRIRYGRVAPELSSLGVELELQDIGDFDPSTAVCDAVLISKCHDAQSVVAAAAMKGRGALVGVDLFDDYFSDDTDSRLIRFRNWLGQISALSDFALCSTDVMCGVVRSFNSQLPVHVMNDPGTGGDEDSLSAVLARKAYEALNDRVLRICWFGVGDNAYFPVGLADLSAWAGQLGALTRGGFDVQLRILTNRRALSAEGLALIERLPIRNEVAEWSEAAEQILLEESLLAFLPVSYQPFSKAKSLNRAVTALSSGCQVLSCGYPLYAPLDGFIYRKATTFLDDFARGTLRLSPNTVGDLKKAFDVFASAATEALKLKAFLDALAPSKDRSPPVSLIHGFSTRAEAHIMVKRVKGFSVASPYCAAPLDFDVIFHGSLPHAQMLVSRQAATKLLPVARRNLNGGAKIRGREFLRVGGGSAGEAGRVGSGINSIPVTLATYAATMREIEQQMVQAFGPCRTVISETSHLPVSTSVQAA